MIRKKRVLIDTDVIINILRDNRKTIDTLKSSFNDNIFYICPVVWMEIYKGVRKNEEKKVLELLNYFECLDINKETGTIAGGLLKQFSKSHGLEETDALIAATAIHNNCMLFTYNKKHFNMIDIKIFN